MRKSCDSWENTILGSIGVLPAIQARHGGAAAQGKAQQGPEHPEEAALAVLPLLSG